MLLQLISSYQRNHSSEGTNGFSFGFKVFNLLRKHPQIGKGLGLQIEDSDIWNRKEHTAGRRHWYCLKKEDGPPTVPERSYNSMCPPFR
mmetsp:Transcript_13143/g.18336  ORF Transcript_13143/g.18336 Transcript_13143/m.18336 type:complete len:89 (+) Transcript_13143:3-269(+)